MRLFQNLTVIIVVDYGCALDFVNFDRKSGVVITVKYDTQWKDDRKSYKIIRSKYHIVINQTVK